MCAAPIDALNDAKSAKILRAAPTGTLNHVPLAGSAHRSSHASILMESGYFKGKKESLKKERRTENYVRWSYSFKKILLFNVDSKQKYADQKQADKWKWKVKSSATVPDQSLSIHTTSYPPPFSSDTTLNMLVLRDYTVQMEIRFGECPTW